MTCSTHIVECLRNKKIYPVVIDTNYVDGHKPEFGIDYENNNFFHSPLDPDDTWILDFTKTVYITGYKIRADESSNWIKNWDFYIKTNNEWVNVDSHHNNRYPGSTIYSFPQPLNTRYIKLKGGVTDLNNKFLAFYDIKLYGCIKRVDIRKAFMTYGSCRKPNTLLSIAFIQMINS